MVLFCHITTRIPDRKDDDLLSKVGGRGFPHLVFMDKNGSVLNQPKGRAVPAFEEGAAQAGRFCELQAKQDLSAAEQQELEGLAQGFSRLLELQVKTSRTNAEEVELVELMISSGRLKGDEATKAIEALGDKASAEDKQRLGNVVFAQEVMATIQSALQKANVRSRPEAEKVWARLGKDFYAAHQAGKSPPKGNQALSEFANCILLHGLATKDVEAAKAGYRLMEAELGSNPRAKQFLMNLKAKVDALEGAGGGDEGEDESGGE